VATLQVLIMAGFDYQGGGVDFLGMAKNRQARLLARNAQLTVTILDVRAGTKTVSEMKPNAAGTPVRQASTTSTHSSVTAANYSTGLGHHARFDKDPAGRMSITDLYAAVEAIGANKATAASLTEVSVFSHGFFGGPILVNSDDNSRSATARDASDKDARTEKDFKSPNMTAAQLTAFRAAFAPDAFWWNWGCTFTSSYRQVTHRFIHSPLHRRTPPGRLKDSDKLTFDFPQDMAQDIYGDDTTFFPQTKNVGGRNAGKFKELSFERTVKDVREFFQRGVRDTYHAAVGKAGNIKARGAFLGTYADYESNDPRIRLPLMEIPRSVSIFGTDFTGYIRMWTVDFGFSQDPEGHGYGVFPP
jgi:hypothetical protein